MSERRLVREIVELLEEFISMAGCTEPDLTELAKEGEILVAEYRKNNDEG